MVKRMYYFLAILILLSSLLAACSDKDVAGTDPKAYGKPAGWSDEANTKMNTEWFYIPEDATVKAVSETDSELGVSFKGCDYESINEYAKELYRTIEKNGFVLFDYVFDINTASVTEFVKAPEFEKRINDDYFYGTAYSILYHNGKNFYEMKIDYFGAAGGDNANAICSVNIIDRTADFIGYYKELNK